MPTSIRITPENNRRYVGEMPMNIVEYLRTSVHIIIDIQRLSMMRNTLYVSFAPPTSPASMMGSMGNTHGVNAVNIPAISDTKAKYISIQ